MKAIISTSAQPKPQVTTAAFPSRNVQQSLGSVPYYATLPAFGAQSSPGVATQKTILGVVLGTLFGGLAQDFKAMMGIEGQPKKQKHTSADSFKPVAKPTPEKVSGNKLAQACMDVRQNSGALQHVHHQVFPLASLESPSGAQQPFWAISGQKVDTDALKSHGMVVPANLSVVKVSGKLLGSLGKVLNTPMPTLDNVAPYDPLTEVCVDFPDGTHVHHGLWRGPDEVVTKAGKTLEQPTLLVVGQTTNAVPAGMTLDDPQGMAVVEVAASVFALPEPSPHAQQHHH